MRLDRLALAEYVGLRDELSFQYIQPVEKNHTFLVPDSAIILSDVYNIIHLKESKFIRNNLVKELTNMSAPYIFFQLSHYKSAGRLDEIIKELNQLGEETKTKIVLCPIGTALGHEDHLPLGYIHSKLKVDHLLINNPTIQEIMLLIANAKLYIGTSLHGVITSMSFGLPYIGLNKQQKKLVSYLKTWGTRELNEVSDVDSFCIKGIELLQNKNLNSEIVKATNKQKIAYYDSVQRMLTIINR